MTAGGNAEDNGRWRPCGHTIVRAPTPCPDLHRALTRIYAPPRILRVSAPLRLFFYTRPPESCGRTEATQAAKENRSFTAFRMTGGEAGGGQKATEHKESRTFRPCHAERSEASQATASTDPWYAHENGKAKNALVGSGAGDGGYSLLGLGGPSARRRMRWSHDEGR